VCGVLRMRKGKDLVDPCDLLLDGNKRADADVVGIVGTEHKSDGICSARHSWRL
jgi:hypothetical protein